MIFLSIKLLALRQCTCFLTLLIKTSFTLDISFPTDIYCLILLWYILRFLSFFSFSPVLQLSLLSLKTTYDLYLLNIIPPLLLHPTYLSLINSFFLLFKQSDYKVIHDWGSLLQWHFTPENFPPPISTISLICAPYLPLGQAFNPPPLLFFWFRHCGLHYR